MKTTIEEILKFNPCQSGIDEFTKKYGRTSGEVFFAEILESNGIQDAIWCLRVFPDYDINVMEFKYLCARRVEHYDKSGVAKECLDVLELYLDGKASKKELANAANAAYAYAAASAAGAAYATFAAAAAAYAGAAAYAAASYAYAAAYAAAAYAYAAVNAGVAVAYAAAAYAADANTVATAAYADEREYQTQVFVEIFCQDEK